MRRVERSPPLKIIEVEIGTAETPDTQKTEQEKELDAAKLDKLVIIVI